MSMNGMSRRLSTKEFIKRAISIHGNLYNYDKSKYIYSDEKLTITCKLHGDFEQAPIQHTSGQGCPECGRIKSDTNRKYNKDKIVRLFKDKHGDRYDYSKVNYTLMKSKVIIICPIHKEFEQSPEKHIYGRGCPKCSGKYQLSKQEWMAKAKDIHGDVYDYSKTVYPPPVDKKGMIIITCQDHGDFDIRARSHVNEKHSAGCPSCSESKGERKIFLLLEDMNISYTREYQVPGTKYRYDFYLPELNLFIEYDGKQHYIPVKFFGGLTTLDKIKSRDLKKDRLAKEISNGIIRIPYTEYDNLETYLIYMLSKHYKYLVGSKYYKNFLELCRGEHLPGSTVPKDVKQYLLYKE